MSDSEAVSDNLEVLRKQAQDLSRAKEWAKYLSLEPRLREDTELWTAFWGPLCAIAAHRLGRPDARSYLDEVIAGGFAQPELMEPELSEAFGTDGDWPTLLVAMAANVPPPALEFLSWPSVRPTAGLGLFRLPAERENLLRARLPTAEKTAWGTACSLLHWVNTRWAHNNAHAESQDAVDILDRVDAGERFACLEYSTVLSHALNAAGIPSRRVSLRMATFHTGVGGGHVVSEAWIDELARWVVLDGQNGLYWSDADGAPLGLLDLLAWHRSGQVRPGATQLGGQLGGTGLDGWWSYFAGGLTSSAAWGPGSFVPFLDGVLVPGPPLLADAAHAYPDLTELAVAAVVRDGAAALELSTPHPYATGFRVTESGQEWSLPLEDPVWTVSTASSGEHRAEVATVTPYGAMPFSPVTYRVS